MTDSDFSERLEKFGVNQVRTMLSTGGFPTSMNLAVIDWLSRKDQEAERSAEAVQSKQIEIAQEASEAAKRAAAAAERASTAAERQATAAEYANKRATIAIIVATISIVITIASIAITHFDALRAVSH